MIPSLRSHPSHTQQPVSPPWTRDVGGNGCRSCGRLRHSLEGSPLLRTESGSLVFGTAGPPRAALHPVSRRRSCLRLLSRCSSRDDSDFHWLISCMCARTKGDLCHRPVHGESKGRASHPVIGHSCASADRNAERALASLSKIAKRIPHGLRQSAAVTDSNVIHHPAGRASNCPPPPPDVNNLAAAQPAVVCQISLPAKAGGVAAPDGLRSSAADLMKVSRREPARPWASTKGLIEPKLSKFP
jgi:hypothetical protein